MTNRTREFWDFAQMEPTAIGDLTEMLAMLEDEEREEIGQVTESVAEALNAVDFMAVLGEKDE